MCSFLSRLSLEFVGSASLSVPPTTTLIGACDDRGPNKLIGDNNVNQVCFPAPRTKKIVENCVYIGLRFDYLDVGDPILVGIGSFFSFRWIYESGKEASICYAMQFFKLILPHYMYYKLTNVVLYMQVLRLISHKRSLGTQKGLKVAVRLHAFHIDSCEE